MKAKPLPGREYLNSILEYNPSTGLIYYKDGCEAFTSTAVSGYKVANIGGRLFLAHRMIWKMVHDQEPPQIDHENHNKADNRLINLKAACDGTNRLNMPIRTDNKSGITGVHWCEIRHRWVSQIKFKSKAYSLGRYKCLGKAIVARRDAERKFQFHPNHGRG